MTNSLRVALLGYGLSGRRFHAPLLKAASGISVAVIVTSDEERRRHAKQDFPNARILNSSQELWASASEIDFVVIASPSASHVPLALMALMEKLHVVVEKPIAPQRGRWDHFYPAARRAILTGSAPPVPLSQVIETMRVLDAARCSSAIGEPVQVKQQTSNQRPSLDIALSE